MNRPSRIKIAGQTITRYTYLPDRLIETLGKNPDEDLIQGLYLKSGFIIFTTIKKGQASLWIYNPGTNTCSDLDDFLDPSS